MVLQMANLAENCDVTMVLVLQMADNSFATGYKRYEINSVNKVYTIDRGVYYLWSILFVIHFECAFPIHVQQIISTLNV